MRYLFKHILLREAAYRMQLGGHLRQMHRKAAEAIEAVYAADLPPHYADLVYHYRHVQDIEREVKYAILAGKQAMQTYAYRVAVNYFERALALLPPESRERVPLLIQLGEALWYLGEYAQAQAHLQVGLALGQRNGHDGDCADALIHLGGLARKQGNWAEARACLIESLRLARRSGDQGKVAHALYNLAWVDIRQGAYSAAALQLAESQALYETLGDQHGLADVLNGLGTVMLNLGEYEASQSFYQKSLALFRKAQDRPGESAALVNLGETARRQGDYAAARQYYEQALAVDREMGDRLLAAITLSNLGHTALACGDYAAAEGHYRESLYTAMVINAIPDILDVLSGMAGVLANMNKQGQALEVLGLVLRHPALDDESRPIAEQNLAALRVVLLPAVVESGLKRGQALKLEEVVQAVLAEGESLKHCAADRGH